MSTVVFEGYAPIWQPMANGGRISIAKGLVHVRASGATWDEIIADLDRQRAALGYGADVELMAIGSHNSN